MRLYPILLAILLIPAAYAGVDAQLIDITLTNNDVVRQDIALIITAEEAYDSITYTTPYEPVSVLAEYDTTTEGEGPYTITLYQPLTQGENRVLFSIISSKGIISRGSSNSFSIATTTQAPTTTTITLPEGHRLANTEPAASPKPDSITSDGKTITLAWNHNGPTSIIVLYDGPNNALALSIILLVLGLMLGFYAKHKLVKKKNDDALHRTLSTDEEKIVKLIRSGISNQKKLVEESGFSKSKMSKVVRRLEEKGVLDKKPHMKTNMLLLKNEWK